MAGHRHQKADVPRACGSGDPGLHLGIGSFVIIAVSYAVLHELFVTQLWVMFAGVAILGALVELEEKIAACVPRWLVFAGDASYSVYLFHMSGIGATYKLGSALLPHEYMGLFLPVAFIAGTVTGIAAYLFTERPLLGFLDGVRRSPKLVGG